MDTATVTAVVAATMEAISNNTKEASLWATVKTLGPGILM